MIESGERRERETKFEKRYPQEVKRRNYRQGKGKSNLPCTVYPRTTMRFEKKGAEK